MTATPPHSPSLGRCTLWVSVVSVAATACSHPHPHRAPPRGVATVSTDAGPPVHPWDPPPAPEAPHAFRLDGAHTGRSGYALPVHPRVLGRVATGARISAQAVALGDGGVAVGSHDGVFYAADTHGDIRWRTATGDRIYTTPWVAPDGSLYLGTDADRFLAVTSHGGIRVALATDDDADTSAVMATDGTLRFAAGHMVYAVDRDLTVRWRLELGGKVFSSPAITPDGTVIFGCQDDFVYAVASDGTVRWRFRTGDDVDAPPMVDAAGTVYVGSDDGNVYALRPDGTLRWQQAVGGFVRAGAALGLDGAVVVGTYGPRARVVALDRNDGHVRWSVPVPGPATREYGIASAPLVDRHGDYAVGSPDNAVYLLASDGALRARISLPADVDAPPVLLRDGVMAVGCDDGGLYLLGD